MKSLLFIITLSLLAAAAAAQPLDLSEGDIRKMLTAIGNICETTEHCDQGYICQLGKGISSTLGECLYLARHKEKCSSKRICGDDLQCEYPFMWGWLYKKLGIPGRCDYKLDFKLDDFKFDDLGFSNTF